MNLDEIRRRAAEVAKTGPDYNHVKDDGDFDDDEDAQIFDEQEGGWTVLKNDAHVRRSQAAHAIQREIDAEFKKFYERKIARDPQKYEAFSAFLNVRVTPKSTGKTRETYEAVVARILTPLGASSSQTGIRAQLIEARPDLTAPKDWTKPTPRWAISKLRRTVENADAPFDQIKVTGKTTLSSLHKQARSLAAAGSSDGLHVEASIHITEDRLYINDKSWKINGTTSRAILSLSSLRELAM